MQPGEFLNIASLSTYWIYGDLISSVQQTGVGIKAFRSGFLDKLDLDFRFLDS